jgi:hypothetical protein
MIRFATTFLVFVVSFILTTILATILWQTFVDGTVYNNTDSVGGYPFPVDLFLRGDWPLKTVDKIVRDNDMSHPDTILKGWTELDLRLLWGAFLGTTILASVALASLPWLGMPRTKRGMIHL